MTSKVPPNLKEDWLLHTVRHNWQCSTLSNFNDWLKEMPRGMKNYVHLIPRQKTRNLLNQKQSKFLQPRARYLVRLKTNLSFRRAFCKGSHSLWKCAVIKEKNATQRANYVAEQKLCFACLNGNHSFRQRTRAKKHPQPECDNTHNV